MIRVVLPLVSFTSSEPFSYFLKHSFPENRNHVPDGTNNKHRTVTCIQKQQRQEQVSIIPSKYNHELSNLNLNLNFNLILFTYHRSYVFLHQMLVKA